LGFAFAHHINPAPAIDSLRLYHENFRPSPCLTEPRAMIGVSAICAETDDEAEILASSADLTLLRFQQGNHSQPLASVEEAKNYPYTPLDRDIIEFNRARLFVGSPETVGAELLALADETNVSEIMITTLVHNHAARKNSYKLIAEEFALLSDNTMTANAAAVSGR
jgi:alkanesulfonate monooxygenase SsuD/methylene tetrahydromethanopterin reductase-like flavin-dependent oxidoreductase (luciferase family)